MEYLSRDSCILWNLMGNTIANIYDSTRFYTFEHILAANDGEQWLMMVDNEVNSLSIRHH